MNSKPKQTQDSSLNSTCHENASADDSTSQAKWQNNKKMQQISLLLRLQSQRFSIPSIHQTPIILTSTPYNRCNTLNASFCSPLVSKSPTTFRFNKPLRRTIRSLTG